MPVLLYYFLTFFRYFCNNCVGLYLGMVFSFKKGAVFKISKGSPFIYKKKLKYIKNALKIWKQTKRARPEAASP